jgi:hypothetical protein
MQPTKKPDFYSRKPISLPRFVYRRLTQAVQTTPAARQQAIAAAVAELLTGKDPDLRKFKFFIPDALKKVLSADEIAQITAQIAERSAHAGRLKMVFPHVSDEFSLDPAFLASVFDLDGGPQVAAPGRFFTIGSCFARNIAEYLQANGYQAQTFALVEDLNSPISNAFTLDLLQRPPADQRACLGGWVRTIYPEFDQQQVDQTVDGLLYGISRLAKELSEADCVVLTLGNVVDFFKAEAEASAPLLEKIFPKFVAMSPSEDIAVRSSGASRLKSKGAVLRLASHAETVEAITCCIRGIRAVSQAPIVVTLSPVPVDSVIGLAETGLRSAIEVDCVSKSRLRSAFDTALPALREAHGAIHYFPSFEIVRWIAPMLPIPSFGLEDACSRHVSSLILDGVCSLFMERFVRLPDVAKPPSQNAANAAVARPYGSQTYRVKMS